MGSTSTYDTVRAWDLPTRFFHWTLVILIISAWVSFRFAESLGDFTLRWHRWNGYAILVLLVFRVLWGFVGSSTSRFASFVRWPTHTIGYARALLAGKPLDYLGHNPLGTWMILALLGVVSVQGLLGLFTVEHNDVVAGPLYRTVSEAVWQKFSKWHLWLFYWVILPLIAVHVVTNVLYGALKGKPHVRAMVTGVKTAGDYEDGAEAHFVERPLVRALVCLAVAAAIVFGGIVAVGGRL